MASGRNDRSVLMVTGSPARSNATVAAPITASRSLMLTRNSRASKDVSRRKSWRRLRPHHFSFP